MRIFGARCAKICTDFGAYMGGRVALNDRVDSRRDALTRHQSGDRKAVGLEATPKANQMAAPSTTFTHTGLKWWPRKRLTGKAPHKAPSIIGKEQTLLLLKTGRKKRAIRQHCEWHIDGRRKSRETMLVFFSSYDTNLIANFTDEERPFSKPGQTYS